uniref:Putative ovule protein n=1 Tax=Solanum chacoense TaxID=4108 RepID=A0A0V0GY75_SOLCH
MFQLVIYHLLAVNPLCDLVTFRFLGSCNNMMYHESQFCLNTLSGEGKIRKVPKFSSLNNFFPDIATTSSSGLFSRPYNLNFV